MKKFMSIFLTLIYFITPVLANDSINIMMGNQINTAKQTQKIINPLRVSVELGVNSKQIYKDKVDKIPIIVAKNTKINNSYFKVGNEGYLNISDFDRAHNFGKGGKIVISNGFINDSKGNKHLCEYREVIIGQDHTMTKILTGIGVFFWPLLFCCFKNGDEAVINKNAIITVSIIE